MRIARVRTSSLPGVGPVTLDLPGGVIALVAPDGRVRRALGRILTAAEGKGAEETLIPHVPDPHLARLPDGLLHRLRTGRNLGDAEQVVAAGARALAWGLGLDRVEAARARLGVLRGPASAGGTGSTEELLGKIRDLEGVPDELAGLEGDLREFRGDDIEVAGDLEQATMEWLRERQDAETHLRAYRDRARELRGRLRDLERGSDADCPVCGRPLAEHLDRVRSSFEEEWDDIVQDGSWWKRRREQLELKPDRLQEFERKALRVRAATERLSERVELARTRVRELEDVRAQLASLLPGDSGVVGGVGVTRAAWDAADRVLAVTSRQLRTEAQTRLLDRLTSHVLRITAGRLIGVTRSGPSQLTLEGMDGSLHPPSEEDGAAAQVAARIAAVELVWESAAVPGAGLLLGEPFDRLEDEEKIRTVDLLRERAKGGLAQAVVLTRGQVVDLFPEGFDAVLELRGDGSGWSRIPSGMGVIRLD